MNERLSLASLPRVEVVSSNGDEASAQRNETTVLSCHPEYFLVSYTPLHLLLRIPLLILLHDLITRLSIPPTKPTNRHPLNQKT